MNKEEKVTIKDDIEFAFSEDMLNDEWNSKFENDTEATDNIKIKIEPITIMRTENIKTENTTTEIITIIEEINDVNPKTKTTEISKTENISSKIIKTRNKTSKTIKTELKESEIIKVEAVDKPVTKKQSNGWKRRKAEIPKLHFSQRGSQTKTSKNGGFT